MLSPADDLFVPAAARLTIALGGGLGAILAVERGRLRTLGRSVLFVRWRTWLVTAPIFGAAVMWSKWGALVFVTALALQGMREYARIVDLPRSYRIALYAAGLASAPIAMASLTVWRAMPPILLIGATIPALAMQDVRAGVRNLAYAALGFAYIPWLLAYFLLIREHTVGGPGLLLALGTAVAVSDVCAFAAGRAAGRHALAPALSPHKTWEGVAGNVAGSYMGFALMSFAVPAAGPLRWALPLIVAVACVWGDLVESLIKRQFGVKDAGGWLPGFGGLLDRIDSLLLVLPLVYTAVVVAS
jgi:phosphatidate cytidylyltransferase